MRHRNYFAWPAWFAILLHTSAVHATFWTVTSYFQISISTSQYATYTEIWALDTLTTTQTIRSGVTPTARPISSSIYEDTYRQLTVIYLYVPPGSVPESDIVTTTTQDTSSRPSIMYVEPVVYTAPASCPKAFTVTTMTQVDIPSEVTDRVTPTAYSTSIDTYLYGSYTHVTAYLSPNAVPPGQGSDDIYSYYIASCRNPTATGTDYFGPTAIGTGLPTAIGTGLPTAIGTGLPTAIGTGLDYTAWVIVAATVPLLLVLFILLIQSYLWFRRLMLGKSVMRFTTKIPARSLEDQETLKMQWDAMSARTKWKLWWRWGIRAVYPVELLGPDLGTQIVIIVR